MIVKVFPKGRAGLDYVTGRGRKTDEREPLILDGDQDKVRGLIQASSFTNSYTSAVLTYEREITDAEMRRDMASFDAMILPGLTPSLEYERVWVRHKEHAKDPATKKPDPTQPCRTALHWICVNTELSSGKRLQPYFDRVDRKRVEAWQELTNIEHGYASPKDPSRRRAATYHANRLPGTVREIKEQLLAAVAANLAAEQLNTRSDLISWLEMQGFGIERITNKSISVSHPTLKKNLRLEGELYELNGLESAASARNSGKKPERRVSQDRADEYRSQLSAAIERKRLELSQRFARRDEASSRVVGGSGQSRATPDGRIDQDRTSSLGGSEQQSGCGSRADETAALDVGTVGPAGDCADHGRSDDLGNHQQRATGHGDCVQRTAAVGGDQGSRLACPGRSEPSRPGGSEKISLSNPGADISRAKEVGGSEAAPGFTSDFQWEPAWNDFCGSRTLGSTTNSSGTGDYTGKDNPVNHEQQPISDGVSFVEIFAALERAARQKIKRIREAFERAAKAERNRIRYGPAILERYSNVGQRLKLAGRKLGSPYRTLRGGFEELRERITAGIRSLESGSSRLQESSNGFQLVEAGSPKLFGGVKGIALPDRAIDELHQRVINAQRMRRGPSMSR